MVWPESLTCDHHTSPEFYFHIHQNTSAISFCTCLWNTDVTGSNNPKRPYEKKITVKVTWSLTVMSMDRVPQIEYTCYNVRMNCLTLMVQKLWPDFSHRQTGKNYIPLNAIEGHKKYKSKACILLLIPNVAPRVGFALKILTIETLKVTSWFHNKSLSKTLKFPSVDL